MEKHEVIKLLQKQKINPTKQRVDIAQLLFSRPQHLCADEVITALHGYGKAKASKATVYNTLNLFTQHGLVREVCVGAGKVYYDAPLLALLLCDSYGRLGDQTARRRVD